MTKFFHIYLFSHFQVNISIAVLWGFEFGIGSRSEDGAGSGRVVRHHEPLHKGLRHGQNGQESGVGLRFSSGSQKVGLSDEIFELSIAHRYLRKNAYRSVSREDLFASLPAYADHGADQELLSIVMEGWLINQGLPEVTVTWVFFLKSFIRQFYKFSRNYDNYMVTVTQRKSFSHNNRAFLQDVMPSIPRQVELLKDSL